MNEAFSAIVARLGDRVVKNNGVQAEARCPAHDDNRASLGVGAGKEAGRCVIHCAAGCTPAEVLSAVGMTTADLFDDHHRRDARLPAIRPTTAPSSTTRHYQTVDDAGGAHLRAVRMKHAHATLTIHRYNTADGQPFGAVFRADYVKADGTPDKAISQATCTPTGTWIAKAGDVPWPLFGLDTLPPVGIVTVHEGEKSAMAAEALGLIATTSKGGSGQPTKTDWSPLAGRDVAIFPDNDDAGEKYAAVVAGILARLDPPARVRVAVVPGLPHAGDVADLPATTDEERVQARRIVEKAIAASTSPDAAAGPATDDQAAAAPAQRLVLVKASEIPCTPINWLWPQRIVGDGLTIITGPVGVSKSLISVDVAARVSTGHKWPDDTGSAPLGTVILFGAEDDAGKVVVPRLKAAGADLERVLVCQGTAGDTEEPENVILERHIDQLRAALDTVTDCRLIVFDPLPDYLAADENSSREVRAALMPLARLAQERNVAVVAVLHQNKKTDLTTVQRIAGSGAFVQIARIVLAIGTHPEDTDAADTEKRRVMLVSKSNYGQRDIGQAYAIETRSGGFPVIVWHAGEITIDADSLSRRPTGGGEHQDRRSEAVDVLRELLEAGEKNAGAIGEEMQDRGFGRRQIDHAAVALNVVKRKHRDGWYWRLPKSADTTGSTPAGGRGTAAGPRRYAEFDPWSGENQAAEIARP